MRDDYQQNTLGVLPLPAAFPMHHPALTGDTERTYQALVENSPPPNATWSEVRALLEALAEVSEEPNGNLTATRNGHLLTLHPALTKDIAESGEVKALRRFLQDSETAAADAARRDPHLLLAIRDGEARLYRCQVIGGIPQLIVPYEEAEPNPEYRTPRKAPRASKESSPDGFYASTAEELQAAGQIVIFDTGNGNGAATFAAWLSQYDSELSGRIMGVVHVGDQPLDNEGLLAAARRFYATLTPTPHGTIAPVG